MFKYTAGMMCLACDANYDIYLGATNKTDGS